MTVELNCLLPHRIYVYRQAFFALLSFTYDFQSCKIAQRAWKLSTPQNQITQKVIHETLVFHWGQENILGHFKFYYIFFFLTVSVLHNHISLKERWFLTTKWGFHRLWLGYFHRCSKSANYPTGLLESAVKHLELAFYWSFLYKGSAWILRTSIICSSRARKTTPKKLSLPDFSCSPINLNSFLDVSQLS